MRLKLVFVSSLLAAAVGSGASIGIILAVSSSWKPISKPGLLVLFSLLLPVLAIICASIFVYRHTARRRRTQAFITAVLAIILSLTFFVVTSVMTAHRTIRPPQPNGQRPIS